jgi:hypothetical protein
MAARTSTNAKAVVISLIRRLARAAAASGRWNVLRRKRFPNRWPCPAARVIAVAGLAAGFGNRFQTPASGFVQGSQSRSARALRAASSSASRAATLAACRERAASITSSIGVERSSCSSLAARETAAAATARLRAR